MVFKTTIVRSNPQVIREFEIAGENTVKDLFEVVRILHGWRKETELSLRLEGTEVDSEKLLKDVFVPEIYNAEWLITVVFRNMFLSVLGDVWKMRLELVLEEESAEPEKLPRLLYFHGLNPDGTAGSVSRWNDRALELLSRGSIYEYGKGYVDVSAYQLNPGEVTSRLLSLNAQAKETITINWNAGMPLSEILEEHTAQELKNIIQEHHLPIRVNQRRDILIRELIRYYNTSEFWLRLIKEMTLKEYEVFKAFVQGKEYDMLLNCDTLDSYGLFDNGYGFEEFIPNELMDYYARMMRETGDPLLVEEKKIEEIFQCACTLYGFFTKDMVCVLGKVMYPEVGLESKLDAYWKNKGFRFVVDVDFWEGRGRRTQGGKNEIMFEIGTFDGDTAVKSWRSLSKTVIEPYIPEREEAIEIAREGLYFEANAEKALLAEANNLKKYFHFPGNYIVDMIHDLCHRSVRISDMPGILQRNFQMINDRGAYANLIRLIQKYKPQVRQIMLAGHTEEEAVELYHLRLEEN